MLAHSCSLSFSNLSRLLNWAINFSALESMSLSLDSSELRLALLPILTYLLSHDLILNGGGGGGGGGEEKEKEERGDDCKEDHEGDKDERGYVKEEGGDDGGDSKEEGGDNGGDDGGDSKEGGDNGVYEGCSKAIYDD